LEKKRILSASAHQNVLALSANKNIGFGSANKGIVSICSPKYVNSIAGRGLAHRLLRRLIIWLGQVIALNLNFNAVS
jgi:hypothetical protein